MCLMIGSKRCKQNLYILRFELAAFAFQHVGNRDFIAMMHIVGELTTHLGLFGLGSVGAELLVGAIVELPVSSALEVHHGDGGGSLVGA